MNQKLWSSLTTAAFIITTLGHAASSYAGQPTASDDLSETNVSAERPNEAIASSPTTSSQTDSSSESAAVEVLSPLPVSPDTETPGSIATTTPPATDAQADLSGEVAKVGEYQSQEITEEQEAIAIIQPHSINGRQAATLYVQDIPVLTFLGTPSASVSNSSEPALTRSDADNSVVSSSEIKVGSTQADEVAEVSPVSSAVSSVETATTSTHDENDPVWRASAIASRVNQLYLDSIEASAITARWNGDRQRYVIEVNGEELVEMNPTTILPDTTNDPAQDALQATNRLRRLLGDAPPLRDIAGGPQSPAPAVAPHLSFNTTRQFTGVASWYGPGFHGNRSASGEVFNQNALTAAHRSLPFGTQVRVTNLNTGLSVVVRITDRGPFTRGRVIDLSAGAARVIGLIRSGVAPVRLDVLASSASN